MKKCPKGHENPDNANYCRICGYEFQPLAAGQGGNEAKLRQEIETLKQECKRLNNDKYDLKKMWDNERHENNRLNLTIKMLEEKLHNANHGDGAPPSKTPVKSKYTPYVFPSINLIPRSVAKVDFKCRKGMVFMVFLVVLFVVRVYYSEIAEIMAKDWGLERWLVRAIIKFVSAFSVVLFSITFFLFLKRFVKSSVFKMNADYIETSAIVKTIFRIAKDGKLGLFDKSKNKVILGSQYDNITKFDIDHLLVEMNGENGLFSLNRTSVIVPVQYGHIEPFKNSVVKCQNKTEVAYYDVNGNRMR